jgi:hypothetical protein
MPQLYSYPFSDGPARELRRIPFALEHFAQLVRYFFFMFFDYHQCTSLYILLRGITVRNAALVAGNWHY